MSERINAAEEWRPVVAHEGMYEVSDFGRVRSLGQWTRTGFGHRWLAGRVLKPHTERSGHQILRVAGRSTRVHALVLTAFVGERPPGTEACHNNGDPSDNRFKNLRWGTRSSNRQDRFTHGTDHQRRKRTCPRNHQLAEPNLVRRGRDVRRCKACHLACGAYRVADPRFAAEADRHYARIMAN